MDMIYEITDWLSQNWLVTITVIYTASVVLYCHKKGFMHTLLGLCAAVASVILTGLIWHRFSYMLPSLIGDSPTANMAVSLLCMLVIFLIIRYVMQLIIRASDAVMGLPVLRGLDQIAGALAGLLLAVICIWLVGSVITMCDGQDWTRPLIGQIEASELLTWLHEKNMILGFFRDIWLENYRLTNAVWQ